MFAHVDKEKAATGTLVGECPEMGPESDDYYLTCGFAEIELGKVVEDMTGCIY